MEVSSTFGEEDTLLGDDQGGYIYNEIEWG